MAVVATPAVIMSSYWINTGYGVSLTAFHLYNGVHPCNDKFYMTLLQCYS